MIKIIAGSVIFFLLCIAQQTYADINQSSDSSLNMDNSNSILTFEERVACQKAIEKVYWSYRIWPAENKGTKPSFESIMNEETLKSMVEEVLRQTNALIYYWNRPITAGQLQAEMDRMAQQTRKPEMLQEIWSALGNDPHRIAECLARPILTDKLLRDLYSHDERFHGEIKRRAELELSQHATSSEMKLMDGRYYKIEIIRLKGMDPVIRGNEHKMAVEESEWNDLVQKFNNDFEGVINQLSSNYIAFKTVSVDFCGNEAL